PSNVLHTLPLLLRLVPANLSSHARVCYVFSPSSAVDSACTWYPSSSVHSPPTLLVGYPFVTTFIPSHFLPLPSPLITLLHSPNCYGPSIYKRVHPLSLSSQYNTTPPDNRHMLVV